MARRTLYRLLLVVGLSVAFPASLGAQMPLPHSAPADSSAPLVSQIQVHPSDKAPAPAVAVGQPGLSFRYVHQFGQAASLMLETIPTATAQSQTNSVLLAPPIPPTKSICATPCVFYSNTVSVDVSSVSPGSIILSSLADNGYGFGWVNTDDEGRIYVTHHDSSVSSYDHVYGYPANSGSVIPTPPIDISNLFELGANAVHIELWDNFPCCFGTWGYYLTGTVSLIETYSISGRVTDTSNNPIPDVTVVAASIISASSIMTVTTDASGYYTFTSLITDTYRVRPFTSAYAFAPAWRDRVNVPPSVTGQDFVGTPTLANYRVDVTPLWQDMPPWRGSSYDSYGTIGGYGCLLTDYTMIINHFGQQSSSHFQTNPIAVNNYLTSPGVYGYVTTEAGPGQIVPGAPFGIAKTNVPIYWDTWLPRINPDNTNNDATLDGMLGLHNPVILDEGGHFVLAIGKVADTLGSTYAIIDPYNPASTTRYYESIHKDGAPYYSMSLYNPWTPNFNDLASLDVAVASPVQLLVTDPSGRRTGYDSATGTVLTEIPNSIYITQTLVDQLNPSNPPSEIKFVYANEPVTGSYQIGLIGTGNGNYTLSVIGMTRAGTQSSQVLTGQTTAGQSIPYQVPYSTSDGTGPILRLIYMPIISR